MRGAESPGLAVVGIAHAVDEPPELGGRDADAIADLVGEPLAGRVAILDRREHRAEKQHGAVGILVMLAEHLADEIGRIAADLRDRGKTLEPEAVVALDRKGHVHAPYVVERQGRIEQPQERPERAARIVVLAFAEQQRRAAFDVTQVDVIAEGGADDPAGRCRDDHHLGLRIVPARHRMDAGVEPGANGGHRLRLGKDLRVGPDADFEILAPGALLDQHRFEPHRLRRAGLELREIVAHDPRNLAADRGGRRGIDARPFLDDALQHGNREGDAGGLDRLQVDRSQQPGFGRIAIVGRRVGENSVERAERFAVRRA